MPKRTTIYCLTKWPRSYGYIRSHGRTHVSLNAMLINNLKLIILYYTRFIENLVKSDRLCLFQYTPLKKFEWHSVVNQGWGRLGDSVSRPRGSGLVDHVIRDSRTIQTWKPFYLRTKFSGIWIRDVSKNEENRYGKNILIKAKF